MRSRAFHAVIMRPLVGLAVLLALSTPAFAQVNTWNLSGVTLSDGTTASGFITYNFGTSTVLNWMVTVQLGTNPTFTARTYDPSNSTAFTQNLGNPQTTIILQELPAPPAGQRQWRVTPASALDGALPVVPINLATAGGGSGSVECFNCSPFRPITGGNLVLAAVPTMSNAGIHGAPSPGNA